MDTPKTLKLKAIGNSLGVILPKDVLAEIGVKRKAGETIVLTKCSVTGRLEISAPEDPEFRRKLEVLRRVIENHDDALRELAK